MSDISVTPSAVDTPNAFESIRGALGEACAPGDVVYLDGINDWKKALADGAIPATAKGRGVVVSDQYGSVSFAAGQTVDIVTRGKVTGFSGLTPGGNVYVSAATAGKMDQTAPSTTGNLPFVMGWAESADTIFVDPQSADPIAV